MEATGLRSSQSPHFTTSRSSCGWPANAANNRFGVLDVNCRLVNGVGLSSSSTHSATTFFARLAVYAVPNCVHDTAISDCPSYSDASVIIGIFGCLTEASLWSPDARSAADVCEFLGHRPRR